MSPLMTYFYLCRSISRQSLRKEGGFFWQNSHITWPQPPDRWGSCASSCGQNSHVSWEGKYRQLLNSWFWIQSFTLYFEIPNIRQWKIPRNSPNPHFGVCEYACLSSLFHKHITTYNMLNIYCHSCVWLYVRMSIHTLNTLFCNVFSQVMSFLTSFFVGS